MWIAVDFELARSDFQLTSPQFTACGIERRICAQVLFLQLDQTFHFGIGQRCQFAFGLQCRLVGAMADFQLGNLTVNVTQIRFSLQQCSAEVTPVHGYQWVAPADGRTITHEHTFDDAAAGCCGFQ